MHLYWCCGFLGCLGLWMLVERRSAQSRAIVKIEGTIVVHVLRVL